MAKKQDAHQKQKAQYASAAKVRAETQKKRRKAFEQLK